VPLLASAACRPTPQARASRRPPAGGTGPSETDRGNPDRASGADNVAFQNTTSTNNNNPQGVDTAIFRTTGQIVFGVVTRTPGSVTLDAFVDTDSDRTRDADEPIAAPQRTLTATAGGLQGSVEAADAVRRVELVDVPDGDEESVATQGSGRQRRHARPAGVAVQHER
jgi:hypothetical protein